VEVQQALLKLIEGDASCPAGRAQAHEKESCSRHTNICSYGRRASTASKISRKRTAKTGMASGRSTSQDERTGHRARLRECEPRT